MSRKAPGLALCALLAGCGGGDSEPPPSGGNPPSPPPAVPERVTAVVGSEGGTIATPARSAVLVIPAGALPGPTGITIEPDSGDYARAGAVPGTAFHFEPSGLQFVRPVRLTLRYAAENLASDEPETSIAIARVEADGTEVLVRPAPNVMVDATADTVTASLHSFNNYTAVVLITPCLSCLPTLSNDMLIVETEAQNSIGLRWNSWVNDPDWREVRLSVARADGAWSRAQGDTDYDSTCEEGLAVSLGWARFMPQCLGMVTWNDPGSPGMTIHAQFRYIASRIDAGVVTYVDTGLTTGASYTWRVDRYATTASLLARYPRMRLYAGSSNATFGTARTGVPNPAPGPVQIIAVAAGGRHSLALDNRGRVYAWGDNSQGQLGDGTQSARLTPIQVAGLTDAVAIAAGEAFSLALISDGTVRAWGDNEFGQLGNGTGADSPLPSLVVSRDPPPNNLVRANAIAAGEHHAIALASNGTGTLYAWGRNALAQLAERRQCGEVQSLFACAPFSISGIQHLAVGGNHAIAYNGGASPFSTSWGSNSAFQLGRVTPEAFSGPGSIQVGVQSARFAAGAEHSLRIDAIGGRVSAWGSNSDGQLGPNATGDSAAFVGIPNPTAATAIAAGARHSLAIDTNGNVWTWGRNAEGQLGDGTTTSRAAGAQVPGLSGIAAIAGGRSHSLALDASGQVFAWGDNAFGQLGDNSAVIRTAPVAVSFTAIPPTTVQLAVAVAEFGHVTSSPAGIIDCRRNAGTCVAPFANGSTITLTATPQDTATAVDVWNGCDTVMGDTCTVTMNGSRLVSVTFRVF